MAWRDGKPVTGDEQMTLGRRRTAALAATACAIAATALAAADPFAFFAPSVILSSDERTRLDRGATIIRVLPARDRDIAIFAVERMNADPDRLVSWVRRVDQLKKSALVPAIARFSNPPRADDLAELSLDDSDLESLRWCRRGDCALKLTGPEIDDLQRAVASGGSAPRPVLQNAFRRLVLKRVETFLAGGHRALGEFVDHGVPLSAATEFAAILSQSPYLQQRMPALAAFLDGRGPRPPGSESFVYWSKEQVGGKSTVNVTEVTIVREGGAGLPSVLVAGRQVFATHYMTGSLGLTALVRGAAPSQTYLVYLNRTRVDVLGGWFSGLVRLLIERRVRDDAEDVLRGLRRRIESGEPGGE